MTERTDDVIVSFPNDDCNGEISPSACGYELLPCTIVDCSRLFSNLPNQEYIPGTEAFYSVLLHFLSESTSYCTCACYLHNRLAPTRHPPVSMASPRVHKQCVYVLSATPVTVLLLLPRLPGSFTESAHNIMKVTLTLR